MKTLFVHDHVFKRLNERYFSEGKLTDTTWARYLSYTEVLSILGRQLILNNEKECEYLNETKSEKVVFTCIGKISIFDRIFHRKIDKYIESLVCDHDVIICRLPSFLGSRALNIAKRLNKKIIVEVVGCPYDSLRTHGSFIAKVLAPFTAIKMRNAVKTAPNVIYVTENFLQSRYPTSGTFINASNVELTNHNLAISRNNPPKIIKFIGSLNAAYKGLTDIIIALAILKSQGIELKLHVLGSGERNKYQALIVQHGIEENVFFYKPLKGGEAVLNWLNEGDIYVQPSHTEGLPRALIEAMSLGLPCVGTKVGGIPELLDEKALCLKKSPNDLAKIILKFIIDDKFRFEQSKKNLEMALTYRSEVLTSRRCKFIGKVYKS